MKLHQLAIAFIALVVVREAASEILIRVPGIAVLANLGGLAIASLVAGWLAGAISKLGPSYAQLTGLAALGVITSMAIGFIQGVRILPPVAVLMLVLYIPLSYVCLLWGAHLAEIGIETPPLHQADGPGSSGEPSDSSAADATAFPAKPSQDHSD
jgi:hypothetical protein